MRTYRNYNETSRQAERYYDRLQEQQEERERELEYELEEDLNDLDEYEVECRLAAKRGEI